MRRILISIVAAMLVVAVAARPAKAQSAADRRSAAEVLALFQEFNAAWERRDQAFIDRFYAHDTSATFFFERRQLQGWPRVDTLYRAMFASAARGRVRSLFDVRDVGARGNVAWLAANFRLEVIEASGDTTVDEGRQSLVFERRDGRWVVVHRHTSFQAPPGPQRRVPLHVTPGPLWSPADDTSGGPHAREIRRRRESSNAAIARHDTAGVAAILAPSVAVTTSFSALHSGRDQHVRSMAEQFATRPDVVWRRTPERVEVFEPWQMASEAGRWSGSWTDPDGRVQVGGTYFAKWRRIDGAWLVEAETYVPDRCTGGAYCRPLLAVTPHDGGAPAAVQVEKDLEARMRDGVILRADVYRPLTTERRPALLQRTPYSKNPEEERSLYHRLAAAGFVVVVQDTRGRYMSDGVAVPHDEGADGHDTVEWVASLPFVDGRVGMFGGSYSATTQLLAAPQRPPHLVALFPSASYASRYDMVFQGGAFYLADGLGWNLGQAMDARRRALEPTASRDSELGLSAEQRRELQEDWLWRLPLSAISVLDLRRFSPGYFDMLSHPSFDAFWSTFDIASRHPRFEVPAYHLTGWYDALLNGTLRNFSGLRDSAATPRARQNQRLIVGPWTHARPGPGTNRIGDVSYGADAGFDSEALMVRWFRHWLGDPDAADFPGAPVRVFVMGENAWRDEQEWPLARAQPTAFHLHSGGGANTLEGDGRLAIERAGAGARADTFTYDPARPVLTGRAGAYSRAPLDQRETERRRDVLVYTSAALREPLEVTGPVRLILWASSSARDTDFTAKLVDVLPDGTARALTDGIIRARYRKSRTTPEPLTPGRAEEYVIEVGATSNLFLAGHRIRLEVSSSNFPRFDRNPNTGAAFGTDPVLARAHQTILHDTAHPSRLVLPVIPR